MPEKGEPKNPLGSTGLAVAANVKRLRESQNLTYAELSRRLLDDAKRHIPTLGLRHIEAQKRRVDADDLAALSSVLGVGMLELLGISEPMRQPAARRDSAKPLPLATPAEVAEYRQTTVAALAQERYRGEGPPYRRIGRIIRYEWAEVTAWVQTRQGAEPEEAHIPTGAPQCADGREFVTREEVSEMIRAAMERPE